MNNRTALDVDQAQRLPLWKGCQHGHRTDIAQAATATTWARFRDPAAPMHGAVAEVADRPVGMGHDILHRRCWTTGDHIRVQDLAVDAVIRGRGAVRAFGVLQSRRQP